MPKFFGKIRQKLLSEGKMSKYLTYAIGEIILVVIGILIALTINTWNDDLKNDAKEKEYLIGLQEDIEKQIVLFDDRTGFYDQLIKTGESLLSDYVTKDKLLNIDSVNYKLSFLMYTKSYPEVSRTFNELNTTGHLNLIKGKNLKSDIINYYQNSEFTARSINGNVENVNYDQIFPTLKSAVIINLENFGFSSEIVQDEALNKKLGSILEKRMNDPNQEFEVVNGITLRILLLKSNQIRIQKIKEEAEKLLSTINAKL